MFPSFPMHLTIEGSEHDVLAFAGAVELARTGDVIRFDVQPWSTAVLRDEPTAAVGDIAATLRDIVQSALGAARVEEGPVRADLRGVSYSLQVLEVPLFELEETSRRNPSLTFIGTYELAGQAMEASWTGGSYELREAHSALRA